MLTHILEHVDDPVQVLKIAKKFLKEDGVLIADVPNAHSLHREL
jgi:2-polyprenyl-3-methyl-5-hydroxy-6-metoxy-1,4-benzoquinol methylase